MGLPSEAILIACSDGLTNWLRDGEIEEEFRANPDLCTTVNILECYRLHAGL